MFGVVGGDADVQRPAAAYNEIERAHGFFQGRVGIGPVAVEDIKIIQELADVLGATVGCSRPIASDLGWLSKDHWVGLSGHKVKPKVYIAAGISGQIQHIAGMRDSGIIVAINKDEEAPIFNAADYGVVGDLYKLVPALTEAIKKNK